MQSFEQNFTPLKIIGEGGFGLVFSAQNKLDLIVYAVKQIEYKTKHEEEILREIRTHAPLSHKNIVRYHYPFKSIESKLFLFV